MVLFQGNILILNNGSATVVHFACEEFHMYRTHFKPFNLSKVFRDKELIKKFSDIGQKLNAMFSSIAVFKFSVGTGFL